MSRFSVSGLFGRFIAKNGGRSSWILQVGEQYQLELFSFPSPPARSTSPEASGLRHIAFEVSDVRDVADKLKERGVAVEPIRVDEFTGKDFTFFRDPDNLPIEIYEG